VSLPDQWTAKGIERAPLIRRKIVEPSIDILQRLEQVERRLEEVQQRGERAERRLRMLGWLVAAVLVGAVLLEVRGPAAAQEAGGLPALARRVANLELKTLPLTLVQLPGACPEAVFSGVNVRIVNGMGATRTANGCGNLIVGYNESRDGFGGVGPDLRTGSHNIIVGEGNNYSSFGGLVAGFFNDSQGPFASVSGGSSNIASGEDSSVSGGYLNVAGGDASSVTGGYFNVASGLRSSVSGGAVNIAGDFVSSVSGGCDNVAGGFVSSVSGGEGNVAEGDYSSVGGGFSNDADGFWSSVSGGRSVVQNTDSGWSAGSEGTTFLSGNFRSP
jgi:hypothetical protein